MCTSTDTLSLRLGFVHPLQDVALHQCLPWSSVCCFPNPSGSLRLCYVVLPSSAWSPSLPPPWLPLCAAFGPPTVLHSCYMTGPFPFLFLNDTPQHCRWHHLRCACTNTNVCLLVGCLTSQQQASVSQGRICSDNFTCCHTEIQVADPTVYLTQSQYTDTGPTSPSADPITPGAWQGIATGVPIFKSLV